MLIFSIPILLIASYASLDDQKVSVTEVEFPSGIDDIKWLGPDNATVLVKTTNGHIFRSSDHGRNYSDISSNISNKPNRYTSIVKDSNAHDTAVVSDSTSNFYVTHDAAKSWRELKLPDSSTIHVIALNPELPKQILASSWNKYCEISNGPECHKSLWYSSDGGIKFDKIISFVHSFKWSLDGKKVIYTYQEDQSRQQIQSVKWHPGYNYAEYHPSTNSQKTILPGGNRFVCLKSFIFVAVANAADTGVTLYVSKNGNSFEPARFPFDGSLNEKAYTILDVTDDAVTIHVQHDKHMDTDGQNTGNIYISNSEGLVYTLSLPNNIRSASGEAEFENVKGLDGVYIANCLDNEEIIMPNATKSNNDDSDIESSDELKVMKRHSIAKPVITVISYNRGATWHKLVPPTIDSKGETVNCRKEDDCALHLHGVSKYHTFAPFYSVDRAYGIIMGTGNVGTELSYDVNEVNTFISRDGGATWYESHKGNYIYEFGNSGSLIVMAHDLYKTSEIIFSWNEGESWYDFQLGNRNIVVENIVIEPTSSHTEFLVYGIDGRKGVIYHLDFKSLGLPPCKNPNNPDSVSSDYVTWIPSPSSNIPGMSRCIMGKLQKMTRKKRSVQCFNDREFAPQQLHEKCPCTQDDYMCSMGFYRAVNTMECLADPSGYSSPDCRQSKVVYVNPYVKIPGNACEGGWTASTIPVLCTVRSPTQKSSQFTLFAITVLLILFGIVALLSSNADIRDRYFSQMSRYSLLSSNAPSIFPKTFVEPNDNIRPVGNVQLSSRREREMR